MTPAAKDVMRMARAESGRLNQDYIGAEHYLLGILRHGSSLAITILEELGVDLERLRENVDQKVGLGSGPPPMGIWEPNAHAIRIIETCREFNAGWIGTEHLLLALTMDKESTTAQALLEMGVTPERIEEQIAIAMAKMKKR